MDTFDRVFCWTLTVPVVGATCYFILTTSSISQGVLVAALCLACVFHIWKFVAQESRKLADARERDLFLDAAVRYFRLADDSEIGLTGVNSYERDRAMMAFARYRTQVLEQSHRRSPR